MTIEMREHEKNVRRDRRVHLHASRLPDRPAPPPVAVDDVAHVGRGIVVSLWKWTLFGYP